jgi:hypothetical protein
MCQCCHPIAAGSTYRGPIPRAQQRVRGAILGRGHLSLRLEHRVDTADCGVLAFCCGELERACGAPRFATSVATSKRTWLLTSRVVDWAIVCVLEEKWLRVEEAQWQRVGFCLGKELSRDWGSFGRATAGCRTSRQGVQCPDVDSGCVLRCQLIERRAIELVGTDSV